jgi:hypothetical protein
VPVSVSRNATGRRPRRVGKLPVQLTVAYCTGGAARTAASVKLTVAPAKR